jgi:predicted TIM-barrel fold metal-dependent hydrolase
MISRIDTHHHFWKFDAAEYAWIGAGDKVLRKDFLPYDLEPELAAAGMTGTIAVQARQSLEETRWLLELADLHPFIHGVVGWAPLTEANVGATVELLASNPRLRAIRWHENMRELAKRPHVYCKISGLVTEADHLKWSETQLVPYMDLVLSAFGPKRVLFGSDWPVCLLAIGYRQWVEIVARFVDQLSAGERERIWSATAREAYKLR